MVLIVTIRGIGQCASISAPPQGLLSMKRLPIQRLTSLGLLALAVVISASGCTMLGRGNLNSKPLTPEELAETGHAPIEMPGAGEPTVKVSIKSQFGRKTSEEMPLEYGMTLQDVLAATKVTRRFGDMKINVMRVTPQSKGQLVPLQARYDTSKNRVGILHDMTLHPGDHIMIVEVIKSPLEHVLEGIQRKPK